MPKNGSRVGGANPAVTGRITGLFGNCHDPAMTVDEFGLKRPIAWVNPSKTGVTLGFREGVHFDDKYGLLRGAAKHAKHVRMKNLAEVNPPALKY
jgi:hypothetical protein